MYAQQENSRTKIAKISSRLLRAVLVAGAFLASNCQKADAQLFYDFVQNETGEVLATLELTSLPATVTEIAGLTFSSVGQSMFGYPANYPGTFNFLTGPAIDDDGRGGLGALNPSDHNDFTQVFGSSDVHSSLHPAEGTSSIWAFFDQDEGDDGLEIFHNFPSGSGKMNLDIYDFPVEGDWRLVPEPTSMLMAVCAVCIGISARRRDSRYKLRRS